MDRKKNVILIVDDTPENLRVLGELLENDGHEVRVANNGARGLEIAKASDVDLILLDVMMPEMDGYEVCKKLKRSKATRDIPVVFLTALDSPDDEATGLNLGAVDYIAKPFKLQLVQARVAIHLALRNAQEELRHQNERLEELVAERTRELADAHRRLLTVDSAKYDFLQVIYQELWAPGRGIVDLSRRLLSLVDPQDPRRQKWSALYEVSQQNLLGMINNALNMAGSTSGGGTPPANPVRLDMVIKDILDQMGSGASSPGTSVPDVLVAGDLDLLTQALTTVVRAAFMMSRPGTRPGFSAGEVGGRVVMEAAVDGTPAEDEKWEDLFQENVRFHPSEVGRQLGLAVPLAAKIVLSLGGTMAVEPREEGGWSIKVGLTPYTSKRGVKINL